MREYGDISFGKASYPFQIRVNYAEVMHILQPVCNVDQLNGSSVGRIQWGQVTTYKIGAIHFLIPLDEVIDVSVFHPLGNHREPVLVKGHPKQR